MPDISVVMPVYRFPKLLKQAVQSVLSQSFSDFELILVDDGGVDACAALCDEFCKTDARISVIHKENGGVSSARNAGLSQATGDYVLFIDSDDLCHKEMLLRLFQVAKAENADFVRCRFARFYKDTPEQGLREVPEKGGALHERQAIERELILPLLGALGKEGALCGSVCSTLMRREVLENLRFENERQGEDLLFMLAFLAKCERGEWIEDCLYFYRLTPNSATTAGYRADKIPWLFRQNAALLAFGKAKGLQGKEFQKRVAYHLLESASVVCKEALLSAPQAEREIEGILQRAAFQNALALRGKDPLPLSMRVLYALATRGHYRILRGLVRLYARISKK